MAPSIAASDSYDGCSYQGAAKVLHDLRWVVANIVPAEMARRAARGEPLLESDTPLDVDGAFTELPLATHPFIREYASFYLDWLAHPTPDDYWLPASQRAGYTQITAPALNISGWYDIFPWSTLQNYTGMKQSGGSEVARLHHPLSYNTLPAPETLLNILCRLLLVKKKTHDNE